ncbi:DegT/DnrJ/EryC1/StrS family aminotransferase [candidate division KSB1 bacterium]
MLAVAGGTPAVDVRIKQRWPVISEADIEAVTRVLRSGNICGYVYGGLGGVAALNGSALEEAIADWVGTKYALAVNSGTAALHSAVAACGIGPGDEVITPAYSFMASAMAILHHNAAPVFVDIDPQTFTMDVDLARAAVTGRTRAIMPVQIHGLPADMGPIRELATEYGLKIIEDAAQAYGAEYKGVKAGALGDIGCFSLQQTKHLVGGEGGLITTDDPDLRDRAAMVRLFGEVLPADSARPYNAYTMGWNYRIPEMSAALALSQFNRLEEYNSQLIANAEALSAGLKGIRGLAVPFVPRDRKHSYYIYRVRIVPEELGVVEELDFIRSAIEYGLTAEGVTVRGWQNTPIPGQSVFQTLEGYGRGCPWSCPFGGGGGNTLTTRMITPRHKDCWPTLLLSVT